MEKQGHVSLWIGEIQTEEELTDYVELVYTEEGEFLPSPFLSDFDIDIDDFDEDFLEKVLHENRVENLTDLIQSCSYDHAVILRFKSTMETTLPKNINAAILLYNIQYDGRKDEIINNGYTFKFVGSVPYI
ncbi:hypothetical protein ELQ35_01840 [Peribacillus cavernae]|uniref:Immunity 22 family protein n=1 Tax=Peribacillus cavernae TaxID=1674310 RepID=A0A433HX28_9BACI|nr:immunity 22 family protein [Peribacillus cavernae]MDQ0221112.1 hypothetical protein [Peribacillus cavernae]RUQ32847.1 hypothetical protein ELQ35_01840 [Peribacillus cavernae]